MKQYKKTVVTLVVMLLIGVCYSCKSGGQVYHLGETADAAKESSEESWIETGSTVLAEESSEMTCFVYVCGEVAEPGVYEVPVGARVYELIELAGGMTEDAVPDALNLAEIVGDGMKLMVPDAETAAALMPDGAGNLQGMALDGRVNLNRADKAALKTLPGIGDSRAEAILQYRSEHGDFLKIEDIMNVPGIKNAAFEKLKDYVTV